MSGVSAGMTNSAVEKLVDAFLSAVRQTGGEAARVWPEVVRVYWWESFMTVVGWTVVMMLGVVLFFATRLARMELMELDEIGGTFAHMGAWGLLALGVSGFIIAVTTQFPALMSPEAAFVKRALDQATR
jgi:hypothetical protein